ncbi:Chitin synthase, class 3 [Quaeritorhiza haematococci]|nr:Chitin synthase, class 3 [Quaeritorhiza haematococci]
MGAHSNLPNFLAPPPVRNAPTGGYAAPNYNTANYPAFPTSMTMSPYSPPNPLQYGSGIGSSDDPYVILLVTCYSEGEAGIRATLESLAGTDYPDDRKLIVVVADGLITGSGNDKSTPDIVVDMVVVDEEVTYGGKGMGKEGAGGRKKGKGPEPKSYLAIADGAKQHNMAQVYAGHFVYIGRNVPIIVIVKCGTPEERGEQPGPDGTTTAAKKPGNRGKRDSQLVLMNFLSRVMFDDRMTELDHDLFVKIWRITGGGGVASAGVSADMYELLLMVDADTVVLFDSLAYMVQAMKNDERIMGLCGETRISNKRTSWVTGIQVFEYYISHHLGKAFESVFGGVTCLPGCFCMYRIKARKGPGGRWVVPILVNPDVVEEYSENIVDTLHKKNLLLLGEDRFLTTLMLRTFPKRKMMFIPQAICRTTVPDEFKVLLSQRRRWINSTIHNLLELVRLTDLCGIFCFSMQFVVALELIGTVVLPAALTFMYYLLFSALVTNKVEALPLVLLAATLGLPGVLIVITTPRKTVYVLWMLVYLAALPVWNFILPVYAFWHFDDFSWGETRKVQGEATGGGHGHGDGEGVFEIGSVVLKRFVEWEEEKMGIQPRRLQRGNTPEPLGSEPEYVSPLPPPPPSMPHSFLPPAAEQSEMMTMSRSAMYPTYRSNAFGSSIAAAATGQAERGTVGAVGGGTVIKDVETWGKVMAHVMTSNGGGVDESPPRRQNADGRQEPMIMPAAGGTMNEANAQNFGTYEPEGGVGGSNAGGDAGGVLVSFRYNKPQPGFDSGTLTGVGTLMRGASAAAGDQPPQQDQTGVWPGWEWRPDDRGKGKAKVTEIFVEPPTDNTTFANTMTTATQGTGQRSEAIASYGQQAAYGQQSELHDFRTVPVLRRPTKARPALEQVRLETQGRIQAQQQQQQQQQMQQQDMYASQYNTVREYPYDPQQYNQQTSAYMWHEADLYSTWHAGGAMNGNVGYGGPGTYSGATVDYGGNTSASVSGYPSTYGGPGRTYGGPYGTVSGGTLTRSYGNQRTLDRSTAVYAPPTAPSQQAPPQSQQPQYLQAPNNRDQNMGPAAPGMGEYYSYPAEYASSSNMWGPPGQGTGDMTGYDQGYTYGYGGYGYEGWNQGADYTATTAFTTGGLPAAPPPEMVDSRVPDGVGLKMESGEKAAMTNDTRAPRADPPKADAGTAKDDSAHAFDGRKSLGNPRRVSGPRPMLKGERKASGVSQKEGQGAVLAKIISEDVKRIQDARDDVAASSTPMERDDSPRSEKKRDSDESADKKNDETTVQVLSSDDGHDARDDDEPPQQQGTSANPTVRGTWKKTLMSLVGGRDSMRSARNTVANRSAHAASHTTAINDAAHPETGDQRDDKDGDHGKSKDLSSILGFAGIIMGMGKRKPRMTAMSLAAALGNVNVSNSPPRKGARVDSSVQLQHDVREDHGGRNDDALSQGGDSIAIELVDGAAEGAEPSVIIAPAVATAAEESSKPDREKNQNRSLAGSLRNAFRGTLNRNKKNSSFLRDTSSTSVLNHLGQGGGLKNTDGSKSPNRKGGAPRTSTNGLGTRVSTSAAADEVPPGIANNIKKIWESKLFADVSDDSIITVPTAKANSPTRASKADKGKRVASSSGPTDSSGSTQQQARPRTRPKKGEIPPPRPMSMAPESKFDQSQDQQPKYLVKTGVASAVAASLVGGGSSTKPSKPTPSKAADPIGQRHQQGVRAIAGGEKMGVGSDNPKSMAELQLTGLGEPFQLHPEEVSLYHSLMSVLSPTGQQDQASNSKAPTVSNPRSVGCKKEETPPVPSPSTKPHTANKSLVGDVSKGASTIGMRSFYSLGPSIMADDENEKPLPPNPKSSASASSSFVQASSKGKTPLQSSSSTPYKPGLSSEKKVPTAEPGGNTGTAITASVRSTVSVLPREPPHHISGVFELKSPGDVAGGLEPDWTVSDEDISIDMDGGLRKPGDANDDTRISQNSMVTAAENMDSTFNTAMTTAPNSRKSSLRRRSAVYVPESREPSLSFDLDLGSYQSILTPFAPTALMMALGRGDGVDGGGAVVVDNQTAGAKSPVRDSVTMKGKSVVGSKTIPEASRPFSMLSGMFIGEDDEHGRPMPEWDVSAVRDSSASMFSLHQKLPYHHHVVGEDVSQGSSTRGNVSASRESDGSGKSFITVIGPNRSGVAGPQSKEPSTIDEGGDQSAGTEEKKSKSASRNSPLRDQGKSSILQERNDVKPGSDAAPPPPKQEPKTERSNAYYNLSSVYDGSFNYLSANTDFGLHENSTLSSDSTSSSLPADATFLSTLSRFQVDERSSVMSGDRIGGLVGASAGRSLSRPVAGKEVREEVKDHEVVSSSVKQARSNDNSVTEMQKIDTSSPVKKQSGITTKPSTPATKEDVVVTKDHHLSIPERHPTQSSLGNDSNATYIEGNVVKLRWTSFLREKSPKERTSVESFSYSKADIVASGSGVTTAASATQGGTGPSLTRRSPKASQPLRHRRSFDALGSLINSNLSWGFSWRDPGIGGGSGNTSGGGGSGGGSGNSSSAAAAKTSNSSESERRASGGEATQAEQKQRQEKQRQSQPQPQTQSQQQQTRPRAVSYSGNVLHGPRPNPFRPAS